MRKRIIALLLALILTVGLLPTVALAATTETSVSKTEETHQDNLNLVKTVTEDGDNYKVKLEAWATGKTVIDETKIPLDIVLVLDESGSMEEDFTTTESTQYVLQRNKRNRKYKDWADSGNLFFKDINGNFYQVTVTVNGKEYVYTYKNSAGQDVLIGRSSGKYKNPHLNLYRKYTTTTVLKNKALKDAANSFIDAVYGEAVQYKLNHRIAIVTYSNNAQIRSGGQQEKNAFVTVNTTGNRDSLKGNVNNLQTSGSTYIDKGIQTANSIFAENQFKDGTRARVMIVFTDGGPGQNGEWTKSGDSHSTANNAISYARTAIGTYKATVYTIGIFDGAAVGNPTSLPMYYTNPSGWDADSQKVSNSNCFMHLVSSNYPGATSMTVTGSINENLGENKSFYLAASSAGALSDVFETINEEISTDTTTLGEEALIIDKIPGNFAIPANARGITLTVANYKADGSFEAATTAPAGVTAKYENNTATVTGFDFSDNWCGVDQDGKAHGQKLIIEFTIKHNNYGGTQPTNNGAGIADKDGLEIIKVSDPKVLVKISAPADIFAQEIEKTYDGIGFNILNKVAEKAKSLADGTKNKFVDIEVKVTVGGTDYTYTIKAGQTAGTWNQAGTPKTSPNVKATTLGTAENYEYPVTITFKDAAKGSNASNSTNTNAKFKINYAEVTVKANNKTKKTTEADPPFDATVTGMVKGENANEKLTYTITRTDAGNNTEGAHNTITPSGGTYQNNYKVTYETGTLTITKDDTTEITVTITGTQETKEYNGQTQTVTGFDYTVTGAEKNDVTVTPNQGITVSASGKDVTSDNNGEYKMNLTKDNFTVTSPKYSNITVEYVDGYVKITPAQVTLTSETASKDYDGTPLTKPNVTVSGAGATVFQNEVTDIKANGSVIDPGPAVDNTITYTTGANFKATNYNISKSEGKLSINDIAGPTNLPTVNVYCTNGVANHQESTGNTLKNNTYTSVVSKNAEEKYICTITLTDKSGYISDYNASTSATHTSDATKKDFTVIVLYYDTVNKAWPAPIVNFALFVKCDTPTVNVTYTWDGLDENDFDTVYPAPTKPDNATPNKGSDYTVDSRYDNSSIAIGKDGVRYKFSGWSTSNAIITADGKIESIQTDVTLTGTWTKLGSGTFDLNDKIFKSFEKKQGSKDIPGDKDYIFEATVTRLDKENNNQKTSEEYTGTVTLNGATAAATPSFVFHNPITFHIGGEYRFLVEEKSNTVTALSSDERIDYDNAEYYLYVTVSDDLKTINYRFEHVLVITSAEEESAAAENQPITFYNYYYAAKEPGKYTIDFSDLIVKCLTKEGSKAFTGAEFTANVTGWKYMKEEAKPWAMLANATSFAFTDLPSRTLTATFLAGAVFNPDNEAYRPFTGDTLTVEEGDYLFLIEENNGGQSNITYDEAKYWLAVRVRFEDDEPIVAVYRRTYTAGDSYNTVFKNETKWSDPIPANITPVTFYNTIDTGKDDYYPIIIPTIINKDTGMLNKTDHFAYVIGYPDGTVHPNGQITRAEVATIFFRLLRDEVRDGAFTTSNTYSDVAYGKWYNNPISTMSALGIITGYPDGTFKPNKPITRAEFAAIAARFDETQSGKSATFSDVIGHWAAKEIGIAYYNDWIKGYPDGTFKPDQNITRAEAMTLINRVLERKPESPADLLTNMNKWTDNMDTSKWYYLDVQEATNSHGYTRKTFNYELWRQMLPDPDWSRYER